MPASTIPSITAPPCQAVSRIAPIPAAKTAKTARARPLGDAVSTALLKARLPQIAHSFKSSPQARRRLEKRRARKLSNEPDVSMFARVQTIESAALIIAAVAAGSALAHGITPNIAIASLLGTFSLWLSMRATILPQRLSMLAAGMLLLLGALSLMEYPASLPLGLDALSPHKAAMLLRHPLLPALACLPLGLSALTLRHVKHSYSRLADVSVLLSLALDFIMLGVDLFSSLAPAGIGSHFFIAPQTLVSMLCLGLAALLRRARQGGWLAMLVNIGIGGRITRLGLPVAFMAPFALLAIEMLLLKSGHISPIYAASLAAAAAATFGVCLVMWTGWRINALERNLHDLSLTDELTGIYNRRGFYFLGQQALRDAERSLTGLTLFFFDLDGLKYVNDTYGHETGSEMINAFAAILASTFRKSDIVGRVGGDEFAVITIRDEGLPLAKLYARLKQLTDAYNATATRPYRLSFSVGQAELRPGAGDTLDSLVTRADGLMYQAKATKKMQPKAAPTPENAIREHAKQLETVDA